MRGWPLYRGGGGAATLSGAPLAGHCPSAGCSSDAASVACNASISLQPLWRGGHGTAAFGGAPCVGCRVQPLNRGGGGAVALSRAPRARHCSSAGFSNDAASVDCNASISFRPLWRGGHDTAAFGGAPCVGCRVQPLNRGGGGAAALSRAPRARHCSLERFRLSFRLGRSVGAAVARRCSLERYGLSTRLTSSRTTGQLFLPDTVCD